MRSGGFDTPVARTQSNQSCPRNTAAYEVSLWMCCHISPRGLGVKADDAHYSPVTRYLYIVVISYVEVIACVSNTAGVVQ